LLSLRLLTNRLNKMNRKEVKEFVEKLHFHGYIDHDITKLDNLIDDYYPKQCDKTDVSGSFIQQLIDKYEDKIKSAENLKYKGTGQFSDVPTKADRDRLDLRIYERRTFIEDLKLLLNDR